MPRGSFRLGEETPVQARGSPGWRGLCSNSWSPCADSSASRYNSYGQVQGNEFAIAYLSGDSLPLPPAILTMEHGSVTDFAVFAAQHLGHVMTTLAVQYERGDIAAHHDRTTPTGFTTSGSEHGDSSSLIKGTTGAASELAPQWHVSFADGGSDLPPSGLTAVAEESHSEEVPNESGDVDAPPQPQGSDVVDIGNYQDALHYQGTLHGELLEQGQSRCDEEDKTDLGFPSRGGNEAQSVRALPGWLKESIRGHGEPEESQRSWFPAAIFQRIASGSGSSTERLVHRLARVQAKQQHRWEKVGSFLTVLLVILNTVFVFGELPYLVSKSQLPAELQGISLAFSLLFTVELCWRGLLQRRSCKSLLSDQWFVVDASLLVLLWTQEAARYILHAEDWPPLLVCDITIFRVVGLSTSAANAARVLPVLQELRFLARVVRVALKSWVWTLLTSSILFYVCSIALAYGTYPLCQSSDHSLSGREELCEHFSTIGVTFMSLQKAAFGGVLWGDLVRGMEAAPVVYQVLLVVFISIGVLIIANIVLGILIEAVADSHNKVDLESKLDMEKRETAVFIEAMKGIFAEIDANQSGAISKDELELALEDTQMNALLRCYKLQVHDAHLLFDLLDTDGRGSIDVEEFIGGCLRMKGSAQAIDIVRLQLEMCDVLQSIGRVAKMTASEEGGTVGTRSVSRWRRDISAGDIFHPPSLASSSHSGRQIGHRSLLALLPSWSGVRIPKVEERAMTAGELQSLRGQVGLHFASWQAEHTGKALKLRSLSMYDVNYNWISPLTIPDGVRVEGLWENFPVHEGDFVSQAGQHRAQGDVVGIGPGRCIRVRVTRGQFSYGVPVFVNSTDSGGVLSRTSSPVTLSYKELVSSRPTKPDWYCCHWWGEPIMDFFKCIEEHRRLRNASTSTAYWICAFANCQHDLASELQDDPEKSSFQKAMALARGVLLVLDSDATPFQRIWCDYELYKTLHSEDKSLDIATVCGSEGRSKPQLLAELPGESAVKKTLREAKFPVAVLVKGMQARLELGDATVPEDKERIIRFMQRDASLDAIDVEDGSMSTVAERTNRHLQMANEMLNAFFAWAAWPQALKHGGVTSFHSMSLPLVTVNERARQKLRLSLAHFAELNDAAMSELASGIPLSIRELSLSFEGCTNIGDRGLQSLAYSLAGMQRLERLQLDFLGCKRITDIGLGHLARSLPPRLSKLRVDFAKCTSIGLVGVAALAHSLPPLGLREFASTFRGTDFDMNFESVEQLTRAVRDAQNSKHSTKR